ncbi:MAG: sigma 54-interacting transcriptional regulator [Fibrobacteres bacterium]|nr:sigma 54-interacting transcriptional regulator [Fibrobacterota bacterium]
MNLSEITSIIKFPDVFNDFVGGVFIINTDGKILYWSRGAEKITGFLSDEVLGKHCSFLEASTCKDFNCKEGTMGCTLYKKGGIRDVHCTCMSKDGRVRHIIRNAVVIKDESGKILGGLESIIDITDLTCAEKALSELRKSVTEHSGLGRITGKSRVMRDIYDLINEVADSAATVLIQGESGTGKELIADAIHFRSRRSDKPFVKVNCSALPETLLESELFGHVKGSFTGAIGDKEGRFEFADGGTLFLDEIGDISPLVQVKLLRVLQERTFERVGSNKTIKVDVRIIAATNRDLALMVREGRFREDLYYRLNVIPVKIPPLRERAEDIPLLVHAFMEKFSRETGKRISKIDEDAMALFLDYDWPGNIRELENAVEHAFVRCKDDIINVFSLPQHLRMFRFGKANVPATAAVSSSVSSEAVLKIRPSVDSITKSDLEKGLIEARYNRSELAKKMGVSRTTLWKKLKQLGL